MLDKMQISIKKRVTTRVKGIKQMATDLNPAMFEDEVLDDAGMIAGATSGKDQAAGQGGSNSVVTPQDDDSFAAGLDELEDGQAAAKVVRSSASLGTDTTGTTEGMIVACFLVLPSQGVLVLSHMSSTMQLLTMQQHVTDNMCELLSSHVLTVPATSRTSNSAATVASSPMLDASLQVHSGLARLVVAR